VRDIVVRWKKILGGCLVDLQAQVFGLEERLERFLENPADADPVPLLEETAAFLEEKLQVSIPGKLLPADPKEQAAFFLNRLDRPLRVCGVVENTGEPGGGPFHVRGRDGIVSPQIVETAQVDMKSEEQRKQLEAATHFNPVDLVCGVRDRHGKPYDLSRYVDRNAGLMTRKSFDGRPLKALERPGLWNGAMAGWNTVMVEVPLVTFSPVKTLNDLLRAEHQQES